METELLCTLDNAIFFDTIIALGKLFKHYEPAPDHYLPMLLPSASSSTVSPASIFESLVVSLSTTTQTECPPSL
ncbi:hypothetical protein P3T22_004646 [Paraburkholderia sp. GAS348]